MNDHRMINISGGNVPVVSFQTFEEQVKLIQPQVISIYQGIVITMRDNLPVLSINQSNGDMLAHLNWFKNSFPAGTYTGWLKQPSGRASSGQRIYFSIPLDYSEVVPNDHSINGAGRTNYAGLSFEQALEKRLAEIRAIEAEQRKAQELEAKIKALEDEVKESKKPETRLASVAIQILEQFYPQMKTVSSSINSDKNMSDTTTEKKEVEYTPEQIKNIELAAATLLHLLGYDGLIKAAHILETEPAKLNLLKTFL